MESFYAHADFLAGKLGRNKVLGGDGTYPQLRFTDNQGLPLLKQMRQTVLNFLAQLDVGCQGDIELHRRQQLAQADSKLVQKFWLTLLGWMLLVQLLELRLVLRCLLLASLCPHMATLGELEL